MKRISKHFSIITLFSILIYISGSQHWADDSGVDVPPAGGIIFKKIAGISMEKEVLIISKDKIDVTFIFKNNTNNDIDTEIAFPVPPYSYEEKDYIFKNKYPFNDFSVWVNNKLRNYKVEAKATLNDKDYSQLLTELGLSITEFEGNIPTLRKILEWKDIENLKSLNLIEFV